MAVVAGLVAIQPNVELKYLCGGPSERADTSFLHTEKNHVDGVDFGQILCP